MRTEARAVVIGGGVIGCSILYHLTKLGWSDVVLLERDELTSGSTWHAAANIHGLHDNTNVSRLQHYTMSLYRELEKETGQGCGVFQPGSFTWPRPRSASTSSAAGSEGQALGMNFYEITIGSAEASSSGELRRHSLCDVRTRGQRRPLRRYQRLCSGRPSEGAEITALPR